MPKALASVSTLSPTTLAPKCIIDGYVLEDEEDYVVINELSQSTWNQSTSIHSNHSQISTTRNTISEPSCAKDDYIELLSGELLQHSVSYYV